MRNSSDWALTQAELNKKNEKKWRKLKKKQLKKGKRIWLHQQSNGQTKEEVIAMADYLLELETIESLTGGNV